jgi:autotransporter-associated beta strand protein
MKRLTTPSTVAAAIVVAFAAVANAALINVDFGNRYEYQDPNAPFIPMSGPGVEVGFADDVWNTAATAYATESPATGTDIPLVDRSGNPTGVMMSYQAPSAQRVYGGTLWNYLMNDAIITTSTVGSSLSVTLSGIHPTSYDLYLYGGSTNGNNKTIELSVEVDSGTIGSVTLETDGWEEAYEEGTNWHAFREIVVGSDGTLTISGLNKLAGKTAALNGFQLVRNPGVLTWTGGGADDLWSLAGNWNGLVPVPGDELVFAGTTRLTSVNDTPADTSFLGITFDESAGSFALSGNGITLGGDLTSRSASSQSIDLDMIMPGTRTFSLLSGDVHVGGNISGSGGLNKVGPGTLTFSGTNTYSGDTTLNGGRIVLDYSGASDTAAPLDDGRVWLRMGELVLKGRSSGMTTETMDRLYMGSYNGASNTLRLDANGGDGIDLTITDYFGTADNSSQSLMNNLIDVSSSAGNSITVDNLSGFSKVYNDVVMQEISGSGRANLVVRDATGYGFATLSGTTSGTIGRLATGTTLDATNTGADTNFFLASGTVSRTTALGFSTITIDSTAGDVVLDMGAHDLVMGASGRAILVSGDNDVSITGSGKFSGQLMLYLHNYSSGTLTFGLDTQSGANSRLVTGGPGLTVWTGVSTPKSGADGIRITGGVFRPTADQNWLSDGGAHVVSSQ